VELFVSINLTSCISARSKIEPQWNFRIAELESKVNFGRKSLSREWAQGGSEAAAGEETTIIHNYEIFSLYRIYFIIITLTERVLGAT
jgi:hypothetical protein